MSEGDCFRRSSAPHHGKHQPRPADDNEAPNVLSLSSSWCLSHTGAVEDRTIFYADDRFFDELLNDPASAIPNGATQAAVSDEYLHSGSERLASPWLESGGGQDFAPPPSFPTVHDAPSFPGKYMRDSSSQPNAEANEFSAQHVVFQPPASATSSRANVQNFPSHLRTPAAQAHASVTNTMNPVYDDGISHQHGNLQPPFDLWQDSIPQQVDIPLASVIQDMAPLHYPALSGGPPADIHFAQFPNANDQSSQYSTAQEFRDSRLRNRSKPYMRKTKGSPENGAKYSCPECPCDFTASPNLQRHILTCHHGWVITCPVDQCKGIYNHEPSLKRHIRGNHGTVIERLVEELFQQMPTNRSSIPVSNNDTALGVPSSFCTRCRSEIKANGDNYRQNHIINQHLGIRFSCPSDGCKQFYSRERDLWRHVEVGHSMGGRQSKLC